MRLNGLNTEIIIYTILYYNTMGHSRKDPPRKFLPSGGGGEKKIVSDNSKCIRTSEGG